MIQVDEAAFNKSIAAFNQAIALKAAQLGIATKRCIEVETSRLADTMINLTPPGAGKVGMTKASIARDVSATFATVSQERMQYNNPKALAGVKWFQWSRRALIGVAPESDLTHWTPEMLKKLRFQVSKGGLIKVGQRGKQAIWLWKRVLTDPKAVKELVKMVQGNVGRAKAGWLPSWAVAKSWAATGKSAVPGWITKHAAGARGSFKNNTNTPDNPSFTLINFAKGIGSPKMRQIARDAMVMRAAAMVERLKYVTKHPEKITQEM